MTMRRPAPAHGSAAAPVRRFVVICHGCQDAWEPDLDHLGPGELTGSGCRRCGGWTWLGEVDAAESAEQAGWW